MKKMMTAALALVLTLGMGVTAMAASVTKTVNVHNVAVSISSVVDKDGNAVQGATVADASEAVKAEAFVQATSYMNTFMNTSVDMLATKDVNLAGVSAANPVTITFNVEGVAAGNTIIVLHKSSTRGWEVMSNVSVGNGTVAVTFTDLSPVAFLRPTAAAAAPANTPVQEIHPPEYYEQLKAMYGGNTAEAAAAPVVSPKTAEDSGMAGFVFGAALCAAAAVVVSRKKTV